MKTELDELLCSKYPKIFKNRNGDPKDTLMCFGFECGNGWFDLLDTLCRNIQSHLDWINKNDDVVHQVVAVQVKEKFGGLRFYYDGGDEYISGLVSMACSMSTHICEVCGDKGSIRGKGWITTLCDEHAKESNKL